MEFAVALLPFHEQAVCTGDGSYIISPESLCNFSSKYSVSCVYLYCLIDLWQMSSENLISRNGTDILGYLLNIWLCRNFLLLFFSRFGYYSMAFGSTATIVKPSNSTLTGLLYCSLSLSISLPHLIFRIHNVILCSVFLRKQQFASKHHKP